MSTIIISVPVKAQNDLNYWALIICGSAGGSFAANTGYMHHILSKYSFDDIYYLHVDPSAPGVDAESTRANIRWAITTWLAGRSDVNDQIFIYYSSHGSGYHAREGWEQGRVEVASDEGNETLENNFRIANLMPPLPLRPWPLDVLVDWDGDGAMDDRIRDFNFDHLIEVDINDDHIIDGQYNFWWDLDNDGNYDDLFADVGTPDRCDILIDADVNGDGIIDNWVSDGEDANNDGYIVGVDFNSDGDANDWLGIDEGLLTSDGRIYWDDQLRSDLNTLSYETLIFVVQGCVGENLSCFSGGLIDDISASNRIIMTATNETCYSYGDMDDDGYGPYRYLS